MPSKPPAVAAPSKPTAPTTPKTEKPDVTARSTSAGRSSPRKRKLSAKAIAAVETELFSPGKAPLSNVIQSMTMAPAETGGYQRFYGFDNSTTIANGSVTNQPSTQRLGYTTKSASDPSVQLVNTAQTCTTKHSRIQTLTNVTSNTFCYKECYNIMLLLY